MDCDIQFHDKIPNTLYYESIPECGCNQSLSIIQSLYKPIIPDKEFQKPAMRLV